MSVDYSKFLYLALLGKETGQKKLEFYTFLRFDSHAYKPCRTDETISLL